MMGNRKLNAGDLLFAPTQGIVYLLLGDYLKISVHNHNRMIRCWRFRVDALLPPSNKRIAMEDWDTEVSLLCALSGGRLVRLA